MRITQAALKEYLDAQAIIKKLEAKNAEIKKAILESGKTEIEMGDYLVKITEYNRVIPLPVSNIRDILKSKADQVLRTVQSKRVDVKMVS